MTLGLETDLDKLVEHVRSGKPLPRNARIQRLAEDVVKYLGRTRGKPEPAGEWAARIARAVANMDD